MAITKMLHINTGRKLKQSIEYIFDVEHDGIKTDHGHWIGGNAGMDADAAYRRMAETKERFGKEGGRQAYHFILSFPKGETTPGIAYNITQQFCDEYLGDHYEHVFVIHTDKDHLHGHVIFNSVGADGRKYHYKKGDWERQIQPLINQICRSYGLSELSLEQRAEKQTDQALSDRRMTWKVINREDIDHVIETAESYEDFKRQLCDMGYQIREGYSEKREEPYLAIRTYGMERSRRTYQLGKDYSVPNIRRRIASREYVMQARRDLIDHPAKHPLKGQIMTSYSPAFIRIQRMYLLRIGRAYRTYYRYTKPYPQAWKYKKDLIDMQKLIDRYNFLHRNRIMDETGLKEKADQIIEARQSLIFERNRLYRKRDRLINEETSSGSTEQINEEIRYFTARIRELTKEESICRDIHADQESQPEIEKKLAREKLRSIKCPEKSGQNRV